MEGPSAVFPIGGVLTLSQQETALPAHPECLPIGGSLTYVMGVQKSRMQKFWVILSLFLTSSRGTYNTVDAASPLLKSGEQPSNNAIKVPSPQPTGKLLYVLALACVEKSIFYMYLSPRRNRRSASVHMV